MEAILAVILQYVSIWAPSLVAILGIVASVVVAASKVKVALDNLKNDKTLKEVNEKLGALTVENEELVRCNKLLLDQITRIKDYADNKKNEQ